MNKKFDKFCFLVAVANGEHNSKVKNVHFVRRDALLTHYKHRDCTRLNKIQHLIDKSCDHPARKDLRESLTAELTNIFDFTRDGHCVRARLEGWKLGHRLLKLGGNDFSQALRELECFCFDMQKADRSRQAYVGQIMLEVQVRSDKKHNKSSVTREQLELAVTTSEIRKVG